jgi:hypothetical protein
VLRRLFTFSSALSLIACVIICAIWARSHWAGDEVKFAWTRGVVWAWTPKGYLEVGLYRGDCSGQRADYYGLHRTASPVDRPINSFMFMEIDPPEKLVQWEWGGFAWYSIQHNTIGNLQSEAVAPFWSIAGATALLPLIWILLRLQSLVRIRRQKRAGLCPSCGYDLRATPGRCPECGAVPGG